MNTIHQLTHLIHADPSQARDRIFAAFREAGMQKTKTALALGCGHATMLRWISQLGLEDEIERMTKLAIKEGWHHGSPCSVCGATGHNARTCGRPEPEPKAAKQAKPKAAKVAPKKKARKDRGQRATKSDRRAGSMSRAARAR